VYELAFTNYLIEWWMGPLGVSLERDVLVEEATERGAERVKRARLSPEKLDTLEETGEWQRYNWFVSNALYSENGRFYDRVTFDFDRTGKPEVAVKAALRFAREIENTYGATPLVVLSGFKGAHVHVFLDRLVAWREYENLYMSLVGLVKQERVVDHVVLREDVLVRVPLTYNHKLWSREVVRTKVIYPAEVSDFNDFTWSLVKPLRV
jgi:hypothetical protein